jgi:saccharopine dehydrogenase-like NADP-dependent oxidoreductase
MLSQQSGSHRLGIGDILDGAWEVVWRRPLDFLGVGLLSVATGQWPALARLYGLDTGTPLVAAGVLLVCVLLSGYWTMAAAWLAERTVLGERRHLPRALAVSFATTPRYLPAMLLALVILLGLSLLLFVPGIVQAVYYTFITQVIVLRQGHGRSALAHAKALVRGRWWRVFGINLLLSLPYLLVSLLGDQLPRTALVLAGVVLLEAVYTGFWLVGLTLLFLDLDSLRSPQPRKETLLIPHDRPAGPKRILVLGGGQQGRVIATDLATRLPAAHVTVADLRDPRLAGPANLAWQEADCSSGETLARLMAGHDLVVGALPSRYGFGAMKAAIAARRNLVDVSFCAEDALDLGAEARAAGVTIVPDAGLAPGISNLLAGEACARRGTPQEIVIMVGGVAQDPSKPYGYCVTWSLDDLTEEYVRPARIVQGGRKVTVPVFSGMEDVEVEGVGRLVAFYSDGLRSLMDTLPGIPEMGEKTLRWPGHAEAVQPLVAEGRLAEELRARCTLDPPEDLVVLLVRVRWADGAEEVRLVDRYDPASGLTAMARTTAFTTAVTAHMLASGIVPPPGVQPLELVAAVPSAYRFMMDGLAAHGVKLERRTT